MGLEFSLASGSGCGANLSLLSHCANIDSERNPNNVYDSRHTTP